MRMKPGILAEAGAAFLCAAAMMGCSSGASLQMIAVTPTDGVIFVGAQAGNGVKAAARNAGSNFRGTAAKATKQAVRAELAPTIGASCQTLQYSAMGIDSKGNSTDITSMVTWTSGTTATATIAATGLATGVAGGTSNISATLTGITSPTEPLTVDLLTNITVLPATPTVPQGATQTFTALATYTTPDGNVNNTADITSMVNAANGWSTDAAAGVATIVQSTGVLTAVGQGTGNVMASFCGVSGETLATVGAAAAVSLQVSPANPTIFTGTTVTFTAMELFSDGTLHAPANAITWVSQTPAVATIDPNSGVAAGLTPGTSIIVASETNTTLTGQTTLTVQIAPARFAYVANGSGGGGSGTISSYSVNPAAATLTSLGPDTAASSPQQVFLHPTGQFMYEIDSSSALHLLTVNSTTGALTYVNAFVPPVAGEGDTNVGVIDPTGRFLYVIDDAGNTVFGYTIDVSGNATGLAGNLVGISAINNANGAGLGYSTNLGTPTWVMTDKAGKYLYIVNDGTNTVSEYSIDQTSGALTPIAAAPTVATGNGPIFGTVSSTGLAFVANNGDNTVSSYTITSGTGVLVSAGAATPISAAISTLNVITDPTSSFLYVLDYGDGTSTAGQVFAYGVNSTTGVVGAQIGTVVPSGIAPTGMAIDPTGVLLAVDNNFDATISLYQVSTTTGALTVPVQPTAPTGVSPHFVVFYTTPAGN